MKIRLSLILLFLFIASFSFAQRQNVYFLKNNGNYVDNRDSADYIRIASEPDSGTVLYNVSEYYLNKNRKLIGKSSTIDPPVFEGQCARFYKNGKKQSITNYKKGTEVGDEFDFYPNGKLYRLKEYPDNNDRYNNFTDNFLIQANSDSLGNVLVENGKGYYKGYDDSFRYVNEEGPVKKGKRDSIWNGIFKNFNTSFTELYKNGELVSGTATFDDGKSASYSKTRATPPQFKGGLDAFGQYLGSNIQYPDDARQNNVQGRVILSFVVEKDGSVSDVKVSKSVSPSLDEEALRVIKNSPHWIPATHFGRNARVVYSVPVNFALN